MPVERQKLREEEIEAAHREFEREEWGIYGSVFWFLVSSEILVLISVQYFQMLRALTNVDWVSMIVYPKTFGISC